MSITSRYFFAGVAALFLAVHWGNQLAGTYGLMFDEAQYWFWGKHPDLGYYSKPPMIAWFMAASTALLGDTNFGAKMFAPLLLLGTATALYFTARRLHHTEATSRWVFLTYLTLPLVTGNAMFFSTDVPLQFFWAWALYFTITALVDSSKPRYWLLAGVAAGLALLSKYTMVAFAASVLLALTLIPAYRPQLKRPWPWVAALVALAVFAPNLWWNAQHQFVTFQHTDDNVFSKQTNLYFGDLAEMVFGQFFVIGPILFVVLLASLRDVKRNALLHCFIWPLVVAGLIVALVAGAQAHWIAPAYLAGLLLIVPTLAARHPRWLRISLITHLVILALFYAAPVVFTQLQVKNNPFDRLFVWNQLGEEVKPIILAHPNAVIMTSERKIAAALTYTLRDIRGTAEPVYKWKYDTSVHDHYDMLTLSQDFAGREAIVIIRHMPDYTPTPDAVLLKKLTLGKKYEFEVYQLTITRKKR